MLLNRKSQEQHTPSDVFPNSSTDVESSNQITHRFKGLKAVKQTSNMSSLHDCLPKTQFAREDEDTFELCTHKLPISPSRFRDMVPTTGRNDVKTRLFSLPSSNIRYRSSSSSYSQDISSLDDNSTGSSSGTENNELSVPKSNYRIILLGAKKCGKTSIVQQFLYDKFSDGYKETMDDMYRGEFDIYGRTIGFDIQDVSGGYVYEFPGMRDVSLASADAFILVFSLDSFESWQEVEKLRDMIQLDKGVDAPIVVAGNKSDLTLNSVDKRIPLESLEATVVFDWENGYVECSAKERLNINKIFKELLQQAKTKYNFDAPPSIASGTTNNHNQSHFFRSNTYANPMTPGNSTGLGVVHQNFKGTCPKSPCDEFLKRRQSLPVVCPDNVLAKIRENSEIAGSPHVVPNTSRKKGTLNNISTIQPSNLTLCNYMPPEDKNDENGEGKVNIIRRASMAALRKDSCMVS